MAKRPAHFSDLTGGYVEESNLAVLDVEFPEGHRRHGRHKIEAAAGEITDLLAAAQNEPVCRVRISFPSGGKAPRVITMQASEVEKYLSEGLISSSSRRNGGARRQSPQASTATAPPGGSARKTPSGRPSASRIKDEWFNDELRLWVCPTCSEGKETQRGLARHMTSMKHWPQGTGP